MSLGVHISLFLCQQILISNEYLVYVEGWYYICSKYSEWQACANSVDPDQTPKNAASDQDLHCLSLIQQF